MTKMVMWNEWKTILHFIFNFFLQYCTSKIVDFWKWLFSTCCPPVWNRVKKKHSSANWPIGYLSGKIRIVRRRKKLQKKKKIDVNQETCQNLSKFTDFEKSSFWKHKSDVDWSGYNPILNFSSICTRNLSTKMGFWERFLNKPSL